MQSFSNSNQEELISSWTPKLLFDRLWNNLVVFAERLMGTGKDDAKDIVSEVFTNILAIEKTFTSFENAKVYLIVATRNRCYSFLEKKKQDTKTKTELAYLSPPWQESDLIALHKSQILEKNLPAALASLSEENREFLLLCASGHSMEEVARLSGLTYGSARDKKYTLLQRLKKILISSNKLPLLF
jgi:RNA polymerase sigma factor (sigma-70 family)